MSKWPLSNSPSTLLRDDTKTPGSVGHVLELATAPIVTEQIQHNKTVNSEAENPTSTKV